MDLGKHLWGSDSSRNAAYLDWKYRNNPNLRRELPLIFMALHGDRLVGMRGVHAVRLEADGTQELTVPCFGDTVIDPEGNPDTSFLARIPADTPFTFQTIDKDGLVLNMSQTWHQLRPGEVRNNCGGCHAHSKQALEFESLRPLSRW